MTALLITRCGCERVMELPGAWNGSVILIPMPTKVMRVFEQANFEVNKDLVPIRKFEWTGEYDPVGRLIHREMET